MLKAAIKHASDVDKVRHRTLPPEQVAQWATKLEELKDEVAAVLKEEKEEKAIRQAEMELKKGENMIEHEKEMFIVLPSCANVVPIGIGETECQRCAGQVLRCLSFLISRTYRVLRSLI